MRFVNHVNYGLANQPFALSDDCGFKNEKSKRTHMGHRDGVLTVSQQHDFACAYATHLAYPSANAGC
jgi:hypothetical protein